MSDDQVTPVDGERAKRNAQICAIVGFFFVGFIFGPIAITQATRAERAGVDAKGWKVLGWIDLIAWVVIAIAQFAG